MRSSPASLMWATSKRRLPTYIIMVLPDNVAVADSKSACSTSIPQREFYNKNEAHSHLETQKLHGKAGDLQSRCWWWDLEHHKSANLNAPDGPTHPGMKWSHNARCSAQERKRYTYERWANTGDTICCSDDNDGEQVLEHGQVHEATSGKRFCQS